MRLALVKTSSMGDVIHALPVVSDVVAAHPGAQVDWVVEESFADLPRLHPAVREVIPVAVRRWRRRLARSSTWREIGAARARLRAGGYDLVLDLQGLVKSAWIARWCGAPVAGFSRACAREPLAALAYARRFDVAMDVHAIERLRSLAAQALGYRTQGLPRFGLVVPAGAPGAWTPRGRYAVLLHATSRAEKQWPRERWASLGAALARAGIASVLPWGSAAEKDAAAALAVAIDGAGGGTGRGAGSGAVAAPVAGAAAGAIVAPRLSLGDCARLLAGADAVVGVDTGLTHLAAALDARTVALFAATPAWRFGPYWTERAASLGEDGRWPTHDDVLAALARLGVAGVA